MERSQTAPHSATAGEGQPDALPPEVRELESMYCLRDGHEVCVRAIRPDDAERLQRFHAHLSLDTIVFRFFRVVPQLSREMAEHFTQLDYGRRMALIATIGQGQQEEILAVVRYDATGPAAAEVAFVVRDEWQGHGLATELLHRLARYARARGFASFVAITMASNARMLDVLRNSGFPCTMRYQGGDIEARLDITQPQHPPYAADVASAAPRRS